MPDVTFTVPAAAIQSTCTRHGYDGPDAPAPKVVFWKQYWKQQMIADAFEHDDNTANAARVKPPRADIT
jgi:hypothetical protein